MISLVYKDKHKDAANTSKESRKALITIPIRSRYFFDISTLFDRVVHIEKKLSDMLTIRRSYDATLLIL